MARFKITATATMTVAREIEAPTKEEVGFPVENFKYAVLSSR